MQDLIRLLHRHAGVRAADVPQPCMSEDAGSPARCRRACRKSRESVNSKNRKRKRRERERDGRMMEESVGV